MSSSDDEPLALGIIGTGGRGVRCFGRLIAARGDVRLAALADNNPVRMEAAARLLGTDPARYTDVDAMLREQALDGVIVTSPDHCHAAHVIAALEAGVRHVLVDKPLATTVEDCLRVARALREAEGHLAIGFNMRHLPVIETIKAVIDAGEIGDLMLIENREFYDGGRTYMARWNRRYAWSGGLWVHKGTHDFDVFNWWNPAGNPVRVSASGGVNALRADKIPFPVEPDKPVGPNCTACAYAGVCPDFHPPVGGTELFNAETARADGYVQDRCVFLSDKDTHDNGIALVEYDNNVRASHLECFVCNFTDRMYTVVGDRGTLMARLEDPTRIELRPRWGSDRVIPVPPAPEGGHGGADPRLLENFLAAIRGRAEASSSLRDGIRAVAVGQAAEIAWRNHRTVEIRELGADLSDLDAGGTVP
jgi:predicted dehydrogenase